MSVGTFDQILAPWHLLKHPFYQDWMEGRLTPADLQDYATQYYAHVRAFPQYLSTAHSITENEGDRRALAENLADEEGLTHGKAHPELWLQFAEGLGLSRAEVQAAKSRPALQNVIDTFFSLARSSPHAALGALYAYESQVPEIADSKIQGLKTNYGLQDARSLEFFEVHRVADVFHRETILKQLENLPAAERTEAQAASVTAAQALWGFLSDVQARRVDAASLAH